VARALQLRELEGETVMNIKALITTLVLGSSSIALADPSWSAGVSMNASVASNGDIVRDHRDIVRDHREPLPAPVLAVDDRRDGWFELTQPTRIERGRETITVDANKRFSLLQLRGDGGFTRIHKVAIVFKNGQEQVVKTDATLGSYNPALTIQLQKRGKVSRIVVYGESGHGARYRVLAA
jgi:hypothetical protein